MKAASGDLPEGDGWIFELKWDGMRLVIRIEDGHAAAFSANGNDVTVRFPELEALAAALDGIDCVLDAEAVAFDGDGRPSFGQLQRRMHLTNPTEARRRAVEIPVVLAVFDVLEIDGRSTTELAWQQRRQLLERLLEDGSHWRLSTVHEDGASLFAAAEQQGLEGVMAKRVDRRYQPGRRSPDWLKVKTRRQQEFVVGGWARGRGARSAELASLAVGTFDDGVLRFAGRVGSGITGAEATTLETALGELAADQCPFEHEPPAGPGPRLTWVTPELVVEVAFAEWTSDGRLRHPAYLGRRIDKDASDVVREP
ncbi:MAG TPA: non-homologous end-joining DNA ligase [Acidimicrobiales bacterium]|nr:non-homologous end-joining DNA ligase [Acidimicrobiales bacterium]